MLRSSEKRRTLSTRNTSITQNPNHWLSCRWWWWQNWRNWLLLMVMIMIIITIHPFNRLMDVPHSRLRETRHSCLRFVSGTKVRGTNITLCWSGLSFFLVPLVLPGIKSPPLTQLSISRVYSLLLVQCSGFKNPENRIDFLLFSFLKVRFRVAHWSVVKLPSEPRPRNWSSLIRVSEMKNEPGLLLAC